MLAPFPICHWGSGRRLAIEITEDAVLEDSWALETLSRIVVKTFEDALEVGEVVSLVRVITIVEDAALEDSWAKYATSRVQAKMFADELDTTEVLDLTKVSHPTGPPQDFLATDSSTCDSGTPTYRVTLSWTNADSRYTTTIYRDSVAVHTASAGDTSWVDTGVTGTSYFYAATHSFGGTETDTTSYGISLPNPCA